VAGYTGHPEHQQVGMPDKSTLGAVYDDTKTMALTQVVPLGKPAGTPTWTASPTLSWGVLGNQLLRLDTKTSYDLGEWRTLRVINELAYGQIGTSDNGLAVDQSGHSRVLGPRPTIPAALASGNALVVAKNGQELHLYALPPRSDGTRPATSTTDK